MSEASGTVQGGSRLLVGGRLLAVARPCARYALRFRQTACWLVRAVALFLLLGTLGVGFSFPLALLFLCAGAAAAALPIGPAGAATQVGASGAALIGSGVGAAQALGVAVSIGALGIFSGAAILLFAVAWRTGPSLAPTRPAS